MAFELTGKAIFIIAQKLNFVYKNNQHFKNRA
jgi:hypothetical protein